MDNEEKVENDMMVGLRPDEMKILMENQLDIEKAIKVKKMIDHSLIALLFIDLTTLLCYLLVFIIMDDHAWFDWVDLLHIFLDFVLILCVAETLNVYRNLKYLLVFGLFMFAVDIIISAYLRPLTIERANPLNVRKVDLKEALLALQAMLTVVDFLAFSFAVYFRYLSPLSDGEVHNRFLDIELSRQKYQKTAILAHLSAEGRELKVRSMTEQANNYEQEYLAQQERERFAAQYGKSKKAAPVSGSDPLLLAIAKKYFPNSVNEIQTPKLQPGQAATAQERAQAQFPTYAADVKKAAPPTPAPQPPPPTSSVQMQPQPKKGIKEQFDDMKNKYFPPSPLSVGPSLSDMNSAQQKAYLDARRVDMGPSRTTDDYKVQFEQKKREADAKKLQEQQQRAKQAADEEAVRRQNIQQLANDIGQDIKTLKATPGSDPERIKAAEDNLNKLRTDYNTKIGSEVILPVPTGQRMRRFKFDDEDNS
jgi:hypothetical protein